MSEEELLVQLADLERAAVADRDYVTAGKYAELATRLKTLMEKLQAAVDVRDYATAAELKNEIDAMVSQPIAELVSKSPPAQPAPAQPPSGIAVAIGLPAQDAVATQQQATSASSASGQLLSSVHPPPPSYTPRIQPVLQPYVPDSLAHSHTQQAYNRTVAGGGAWRSELCDCDCCACCAACWFPSVTTSQLLERTKDSEPSCGCCLARCCCLSGLLPTMILLGGGRFLCDTGNSLDFMCDYFYLEYYRDGFWYYYQVPYFSVYAASAITLVSLLTLFLLCCVRGHVRLQHGIDGDCCCDCCCAYWCFPCVTAQIFRQLGVQYDLCSATGGATRTQQSRTGRASNGAQEAFLP